VAASPSWLIAAYIAVPVATFALCSASSGAPLPSLSTIPARLAASGEGERTVGVVRRRGSGWKVRQDAASRLGDGHVDLAADLDHDPASNPPPGPAAPRHR
jgi:hypothetical protein